MTVRPVHLVGCRVGRPVCKLNTSLRRAPARVDLNWRPVLLAIEPICYFNLCPRAVRCGQTPIRALIQNWHYRYATHVCIVWSFSPMPIWSLPLRPSFTRWPEEDDVETDNQISTRGYTEFPTTIILSNLWCHFTSTRTADFSGPRDGWIRTYKSRVNQWI